TFSAMAVALLESSRGAAQFGAFAVPKGRQGRCWRTGGRRKKRIGGLARVLGISSTDIRRTVAAQGTRICLVQPAVHAEGGMAAQQDAAANHRRAAGQGVLRKTRPDAKSRQRGGALTEFSELRK